MNAGVIKDWLTCKPGSVSAALLPRTSAIYLAAPLLVQSSSLPLPASATPPAGGAEAKRAVLPCDRDIFGFATHEAYGSRNRSRDRCALTTPFHPYPG